MRKSIEVEDMLDIEKVSKRQNEELLRVARLQGQWTSTKSLQSQAESLGTEGPIIGQFKVAIERIENELATLGAIKPEVDHE